MSSFDDETRSRIMRAIGPDDTEPERIAVRALESLGVEYQKQPSFGRYRPDFQLEDGTVLQIHGCFWHGCPCVTHSMDEVDAHSDYWMNKHEENVERDRRRRRELLSEYDVPLVFWIWGHEDVAARVAALCDAIDLGDTT